MRNGTKRSVGRGRPRKFDEQASLSGACGLFLDKGYSGASLDDLAQAMGINRPSMYNAFGNKAAIYERSLRHYFDTLARPLAEALKQENLRQALEAYFQGLLDFYCDEGGRGCLCTSTLPAEVLEQPEFRRLFRELLEGIDTLLYQRLEQEGHNETNTWVAQLLQGVMQTLSLRARSGVPREDLEALYRCALDRLVGQT